MNLKEKIDVVLRTTRYLITGEKPKDKIDGDDDDVYWLGDESCDECLDCGSGCNTCPINISMTNKLREEKKKEKRRINFKIPLTCDHISSSNKKT